MTDTPVIRVAGALLVLGTSWLALGEWRQLAEARRIAAGREELTTLMAQCRGNVAQGNDAAALAPALELIRRQPHNHIYLQQLAGVESRLGRFREEAATWEDFIQYSPQPVEACPDVGIAYRKAGLVDRAMEALNRCVALDPRDSDFIYQLGYTLEVQARAAEAEDYYRKGLSIDPAQADLLLGSARLEFRAGHADQAFENIQKVLTRQPEDSDALLLAGMIRMSQNRLSEAKAFLSHAEVASVRDPDIQIALGNLAEKEHDKPGAIRHYHKAKQLHPEDKEAAARLAVLELTVSTKVPH